MRFLNAKWIGTLALALALGTTGIGCGDDDDSGAGDGGPDGGAMDGGGGGSGGSNGGKKDGGSDSGTKTGGGGSGGTSGGTGGSGMLPMAPTCDTSIKTSATCGSKTCAAATSQFATFVCSAGCCLSDNTCGFRRAVKDAVTDCRGPAVEDPSCPPYMAPAAGMMMSTPDGGDAGGMQFPGCCAPSGKCGIISTIDMSCITSSILLSGLKPGAPCGEGVQDGGANDAGN